MQLTDYTRGSCAKLELFGVVTSATVNASPVIRIPVGSAFRITGGVPLLKMWVTWVFSLLKTLWSKSRYNPVVFSLKEAEPNTNRRWWV